MLRIVLVLLLSLGASAAMAADHLLPMDPGVNSLHQNTGENWFKALKKGDITFLEFDTFPALGPLPSYLAVIGPNLQGPFRLCYLEDAYDKRSPVCVPIPIEFAHALDDRVENIIRQDTYYDQKDDLSPVDPTMYYFKANFVFAETRYADGGSAPALLIKALSKCAKLAKMTPTDPGRQAAMDEILKELDAIKLPDR